MSRPLVLDVDATFLRTDMLLESFWAGLGRAPLATLGASVRLFGDRPALKQELARISRLRTDLLPVNADIAGLAANAMAEGRDVVLASAGDAGLVTELARHHGLSDAVLGSTPGQNLKGQNKATALVERYGERGFDYAGDNRVDHAVWDQAEGAVIVGAHPAIAKALRDDGHPVEEIPRKTRRRDMLRAIRPHQWVKNILLLVPLIAAHDFDPGALLLVVLGMAAFSAAASSIYIVNDLLDLEADRLHATKCNRPFASGAVGIGTGMLMWLVLTVAALGIGSMLGPPFLAVIVIYMFLSLAYSLRLKRMRWVDIATLAGLYTIRVIAGVFAAKITFSPYLLGFIFPVFLTLGCVKRLTEVTLAKGDSKLPGRGYTRADRGALLGLAIVSLCVTMVIFVGYSFTAQGLALYPTQWLLWVAAVPLALWLIRMVWLGHAGEQDYDPILFAMSDKMGLGLIMIMLALMFQAAGLWQQWFG